MYDETNQDHENVDEFILENVDLYSVLNVSHKATQIEIQSAFKKLSRIYHPDKHTKNEEDYKNAQELFSKIREAYGILSDEKKRQVYDLYGVEGIKSENWEIVSRTANPNEIKYIYENRKKLNEEELADRLTRPETMFTMKFDFTDIFDRYLKGINEEFPPSIDIVKTELRQSVIVGMTNTDTCTLTAICMTKGGLGTGQLVANYKKNLYPYFNDANLNFQFGFTTNYEASTEISVTKTCWDKVTFKLGLIGVIPEFLSIIPVPFAEMTWTITDHLKGTVEYSLQDKIKTSLTWNSKDQKHLIKGGFHISSPENFHLVGAYNYIYQFARPDNSKHRQYFDENGDINEEMEPIRFKINGQVGTHRCFTSLNLTRRVTKFTAFGMSLTFGVPIGVMTELMLHRGNQLYVFPLLMSEELEPAAIFYGTLVPNVIYFVLKKLLYDPWKKNERKREQQKKREASRSELEKRRNEAYMAQSLMKESGRKSYLREKDGGLIIERAMYGLLITRNRMNESFGDFERSINDYSEDAINQKIVDVTVPLQVMVENSQLELPACRPGQTRGNLQGFYDPCIGLFSFMQQFEEENHHSEIPIVEGDQENDTVKNKRQLYVRYRFKDRVHEVIVSDAEDLRIPLQKHLINT